MAGGTGFALSLCAGMAFPGMILGCAAQAAEQTFLPKLE
jgi:hypothetical protein